MDKASIHAALSSRQNIVDGDIHRQIIRELLAENDRQAAELADEKRQHEFEQNSHDITRGEIESLRAERDEAKYGDCGHTKDSGMYCRCCHVKELQKALASTERERDEARQTNAALLEGLRRIDTRNNAMMPRSQMGRIAETLIDLHDTAQPIAQGEGAYKCHKCGTTRKSFELLFVHSSGCNVDTALSPQKGETLND